MYTARTAAVGTGAATTTIIAGSSSSSSTAGTTISAGRALTTGGATLGSIATSRAGTSIGTAATVGGIASEIGSTSVESTVGINSVLDSASSSSTTTILADVQGAMSGVEDVILGDATTSDALISGAQSSTESIAGGIGGEVLSVAGDAGVGVLSMLPAWLVSGGLAVLASELAFAVFAIFILLRAGGSAAKEVIVNSKEKEINIKEEKMAEEILDIETREVTSEENEEHVEL